MKTPTVLVAAALTASILLTTASLLIAAGTRNEPLPVMRGASPITTR
jgi:hypothetical protein